MINPHLLSAFSQRHEITNKFARRRYREVRLDRCQIGPLLDEHDPVRVFCINMTIVGDAAGFGALAGRVFYAQHQCFGAVFGADGGAAGDDDHLPSLAGRA